MDEVDVISAIRKSRLDRGLTFQQLADEISSTVGGRISMRGLHRILTSPQAHVHERTLHTLRTYLRSWHPEPDAAGAAPQRDIRGEDSRERDRQQ